MVVYFILLARLVIRAVWIILISVFEDLLIVTDYLLIHIITSAVSEILIWKLFLFHWKKVELILVVYLVVLLGATSHSSGNLFNKNCERKGAIDVWHLLVMSSLKHSIFHNNYSICCIENNLLGCISLIRMIQMQVALPWLRIWLTLHFLSIPVLDLSPYGSHSSMSGTGTCLPLSPFSVKGLGEEECLF